MRCVLRVRPNVASEGTGTVLQSVRVRECAPAVDAQEDPLLGAAELAAAPSALCALATSLRKVSPRVAVLHARRAGGARGDERSALLPPLHVSMDGMFEPSRPPMPEAEQSAVFSAVSDMVAAAVYMGRSGCVLAYGSTGEYASHAP